MRRALNQGQEAPKAVERLLGLGDASRICIVVDQFEELFRFAAESDHDEASLMTDFLVGFQKEPPKGLYVLVTMRSEFLGACARFEGLAETINRTQYLLPRMNTDDLIRAIREPAALYGGHVTYALAERLIADARLIQDSLPLIQHGLSRLWGYASPTKNETAPVLDLPAYVERGPLDRLLSEHADGVACAFAKDPTTQKIVEELFRALTDTDARGNPIRRPQIFRELVAVTGTTEHHLRTIMDGFRQTGVSFVTPYSPAEIHADTMIDISHEALIRCWKRIADRHDGWLQREFRDGLIWRSLLVQAESFVADPINLLPEATTEARKKWLQERNEAWASRYGGQWSNVGKLVESSWREVERQREQRQHAESNKFLQRKRELELRQAIALAAEQKKVARWMGIGLSVATVAFAFAIATAFLAYTRGNFEREQKLIAQVSKADADASERLSRSFYFAGQSDDILVKATPKAAYYFELQRDAARGAKKSINELADKILGEWRGMLTSTENPLEDEQKAISDINSANEALWKNRTSELERKTIIANIESVLTGGNVVDGKKRNSQSALRLALYAVAAIPQEYANLNELLRNSIVDFRLQRFFKPPGGSQIWGIAVNPQNPHQAAIGDDNGVVWLWDPVTDEPRDATKQFTKAGAAVARFAFGADGSLGVPALTASGGVVNGVAFSADGSLLAAAYRNTGVAVWASESPSVRCPLSPVGANSGAYSVAFFGKYLAIGGRDRAVHLWKVSQTGCEETQALIRPDLVFGVGFHPAGKLLAAASGDGTVTVWNIKTSEDRITVENVEGKPLKEFKFDEPMYAVAFSPDGSKLAAAGADKKGYIWNVESWTRTILPSEGGTIGQISFSPTQNFLVANAGRDGDAIVKRLDTNDKPIRLDNAAQELFGVAFASDRTNANSISSDNLLLVTGNLNGVAAAWMITGKDDVRGAAGRNALITFGAKRMASMQLDQQECRKLRAMKIPIFQEIDRLWKGTGANCPYPFLAR